MSEFFGKYRGLVVNNVDPLQQGRIQVSCPSVLGPEMPSWAMPNAPFVGIQMGMFAIPQIGAKVWVEFEAGDPDKPIWSGGFWGPGEAPALPPVPQVVTIKMLTGSVTINDLIGSVIIETTIGAKIMLSPAGIEIDNGQGASIRMIGPMVSINNGALDVT